MPGVVSEARFRAVNRSSAGLILPPDYVCEECRAKDRLVAALKQSLADRSEELERMYGQVGNTLSNRAERRNLANRRRALARGRGNGRAGGKVPTRQGSVRRSELERLSREVSLLEARVSSLHQLAQTYWRKVKGKELALARARQANRSGRARIGKVRRLEAIVGDRREAVDSETSR